MRKKKICIYQRKQILYNFGNGTPFILKWICYIKQQLDKYLSFFNFKWVVLFAYGKCAIIQKVSNFEGTPNMYNR